MAQSARAALAGDIPVALNLVMLIVLSALGFARRHVPYMLYVLAALALLFSKDTQPLLQSSDWFLIV